MKLPLSWIREALGNAYKESPEKLTEQLTSLGLEVDSIAPVPLGFEEVVVGKVLSTERHPEADKLCVAQVTDGQQTYQVVCGAANCRAELVTAFARIGARLTDEKGESFKIKKGKLRGVESHGMLCSADELGLPGDAAGIMELDPSLTLGTPLTEIYGEQIVEISLTPNLGHCLSLLGVARELSALTGLPYKVPSPTPLQETSTPPAKVTVKDPVGCPRYACAVIRGVKIGPSPVWLKARIEGCGMRSVNNVVDVTNLVMMERGHPIHAFDYDRLTGGGIVVRAAEADEPLVTLDGVPRKLEEGMLVICDFEKPVALAGIMGGINSEVTDETTNILLEVAYFDPRTVRRTSKKLGLSTEGSRRFERGTDPHNVPHSLSRTVALIIECAGGAAAPGIVDIYTDPFLPKQISCRVSRINQLLGLQLPQNEIEKILSSLEFSCAETKPGVLNITIPTYRNDISIEEDIAEEVARLYGYDRFPMTLAKSTACPLPHSTEYLFEREVRHQLIALGLQELMTCDLIGPSQLGLLREADFKGRMRVEVCNPTSVEQSILRPSLLPGLLEVVKHNIAHQNHDIAAFEVGRIHFKSGETFMEHPLAGIVLTGRAQPHHWEGEDRQADLYDLKGIVESLTDALHIPEALVTFHRSSHPNFHPGRQAEVRLGDLPIGVLGEVHPSTQRDLDVTQRIYYAEIDLPALFSKRVVRPQLEPLPMFPGSERDWTLTVAKSLPAGDLLRAIDKAPSNLLARRGIISVYENEKLGPDKRNITINFLYRHDKKTLAQEAVDKEHTRVMQAVLAELGNSVVSL